MLFCTYLIQHCGVRFYLIMRYFQQRETQLNQLLALSVYDGYWWLAYMLDLSPGTILGVGVDGTPPLANHIHFSNKMEMNCTTLLI